MCGHKISAKSQNITFEDIGEVEVLHWNFSSKLIKQEVYNGLISLTWQTSQTHNGTMTDLTYVWTMKWDFKKLDNFPLIWPGDLVFDIHDPY